MGKLRSAERVANFPVRDLGALWSEACLGGAPHFYIKRGDIADYLGLTIETVSRAFTDLKKRRVIALINSDAIAILDATQLAALGKFKIGADRDGSLGGIAV